MTSDDQTAFDQTLEQLRTIPRRQLEHTATHLTMLATGSPEDTRQAVLLAARLVYVLAHEDQRG
jgi:hypothetical protein